MLLGALPQETDVDIPPVVATIAKILITGAEIAVVGYFTIRFTLDGIRYFTVVAAQDKANLKNRLLWTVLYATIAFLIIFIFSALVGL